MPKVDLAGGITVHTFLPPPVEFAPINAVDSTDIWAGALLEAPIGDKFA